MSRLSVIVALCVVALLAWFFATHELRREMEHVGLRGRALTEPYLAATRVLTRMGKTVDTNPAPLRFDALPAGTTLFLDARDGGEMPEQQVEQLLAWVAAGNHLVLEATDFYVEDVVADWLDIERSVACVFVKLIGSEGFHAETGECKPI